MDVISENDGDEDNDDENDDAEEDGDVPRRRKQMIPIYFALGLKNGDSFEYDEYDDDNIPLLRDLHFRLCPYLCE